MVNTLVETWVWHYLNNSCRGSFRSQYLLQVKLSGGGGGGENARRLIVFFTARGLHFDSLVKPITPRKKGETPLKMTPFAKNGNLFGCVNKSRQKFLL